MQRYNAEQSNTQHHSHIIFLSTYVIFCILVPPSPSVVQECTFWVIFPHSDCLGPRTIVSLPSIWCIHHTIKMGTNINNLHEVLCNDRWFSQKPVTQLHNTCMGNLLRFTNFFPTKFTLRHNDTLNRTNSPQWHMKILRAVPSITSFGISASKEIMYAQSRKILLWNWLGLFFFQRLTMNLSTILPSSLHLSMPPWPDEGVSIPLAPDRMVGRDCRVPLSKSIIHPQLEWRLHCRAPCHVSKGSQHIITLTDRVGRTRNYKPHLTKSATWQNMGYG